MSIRPPALVFLASALLAFASVEAAANDLATLQSTERPQPTQGGPVPTMATFGLCTGPQNALDFPANPVPVTEDRCNYRQRFSATSVAASNAPGSCGGYSVGFGPMGDLKRDMKTVRLTAEWGDAPIASAGACATARLAAVAWGYRCDNDACTQGGWEKIEVQRQTEGSWSSAGQSCTLRLAFAGTDNRYKTLNLDVITSQMVNGSRVRKRAKGTMEVERGNGQCFSGSAGTAAGAGVTARPGSGPTPTASASAVRAVRP
jgi:hypothetical protein